MTTHGQSSSATYKTWASMIQRCTNERMPQYPDYGGRGIMVCERWLSSFENFLSDMGTRPRGMTIDRRDNDGDYEPGNCRWATRSTQQRNTRATVMITAWGVTKSLAEWIDGRPFTRTCVMHRLKNLGWPPEKALTEPSDRRANSQTKMNFARARELRSMRKDGATYREIASHFGIGMTTVHYIVCGKFWQDASEVNMP